MISWISWSPTTILLLNWRRKKCVYFPLIWLYTSSLQALPASPQQIVVEPFAGNLPPAAFHLLHLLLVFGSHLQVSLPPPEGREKRNRETNEVLLEVLTVFYSSQQPVFRLKRPWSVVKQVLILAGHKNSRLIFSPKPSTGSKWGFKSLRWPRPLIHTPSSCTFIFCVRYPKFWWKNMNFVDNFGSILLEILED